MNSVSPVLTETEVSAEQVIALEQKEYYPVISLQINYGGPDGDHLSLATLTRFRFSDKEREAIANGADLLLSQPHHGPRRVGTRRFSRGRRPRVGGYQRVTARSRRREGLCDVAQRRASRTVAGCATAGTTSFARRDRRVTGRREDDDSRCGSYSRRAHKA